MDQEKIKKKKCNECGEEKPATLEFFHKKRNGLRPDCKVCKRAKAREHYYNNLEKEKARKAKYSRENREKINAYQSEWRKKNPERMKQLKKKHYEKNKEKVLAKNAKYREANKEKISARHREYHRNRRISEGKPLGSQVKPHSLYIGYVDLEGETFFKVGITSYDCMADRYTKDRNYRGILDGVHCVYYQHIGADDVRKAERDLVGVCREVIGKPVKGNEWFSTPTIQQLVTIMGSVNA